ncbi:MAG TPA: ABC transporter permease [Gemmataceae bacterium]|nr:ABC transporter permease [Gemmataceae bacterium]
MEALKAVLTWLVAVVAAGAGLAVVLIPTLSYFDDLFTKVLIVAASAAVVLLLLVVFHRPILFYLRFVLKSLFRNPLRTGLTAAATMLLVFIVTLVWTVLWFLHMVTAEKSKDLKAIVTERWQIPSQMPFSYGADLAKFVPPPDSMTWQFYGGTLDPGKLTRENIVFFFCMDPKKFLTMMDGIDEFTPDQVEQLKKWADEMVKDKHKVLIGMDRLKALNKKPGEHFTVHSINYKDIDLDVEILGALPAGRYGQSAVMNFQYLNDALFEDYPRQHQGAKHPLADKTLNLVWLRVPDVKAYERVADEVEKAYADSTPSVKCETASSGVAAFLDAYRDLLWGMEYLFTPIALASMAVVIATAISISVRERRSEMAILKVLGFGPWRILFMILGEGLLIGAGSGFLSVAATYLIVNVWYGGIPFPIAFFPAFKIPALAFVWGPLIGGGTALVGSIVPACNAMYVNVAQVFAKTA